MSKQIVVINGSGGAGKDTFVMFCGGFAEVTNVSSVDCVKMAANMLGWCNAKTEKDRKFLSDIKLLATEYCDHPYQYIKDSIKGFLDDDTSNLMFIHIREPEEIERVKEDFGAKTLLITNKNVQDINTNMADANVEKYNYDYIINNDYDLNDLRVKACMFVNELLGK